MLSRYFVSQTKRCDTELHPYCVTARQGWELVPAPPAAWLDSFRSVGDKQCWRAPRAARVLAGADKAGCSEEGES